MKVLAAIFLLGLAACTDDVPEVAPTEARDPSVFDPLTETLQRAESVESTLKDSEADRRRQLDALETD